MITNWKKIINKNKIKQYYVLKNQEIIKMPIFRKHIIGHLGFIISKTVIIFCIQFSIVYITLYLSFYILYYTKKFMYSNESLIYKFLMIVGSIIYLIYMWYTVYLVIDWLFWIKTWK